MDGPMIAVIGGIATALITAVVALVKIAVGEARGRADDWRAHAGEWRDVARMEQQTGEVRDGHVERLVGAVEALTQAQRESVAMLRSVAEFVERSRGAA